MFDHATDLHFINLSNNKRVFLFLQGPSSPFFQKLADALVENGHEVRRINICFGDRLFWSRPGAAHYRGKLQGWPEFINKFLHDEKITDIILLGDRRPHHLIALEKARAQGLGCYVTELGYIRPDWITFERDGMSSYSRFPTDPKVISAIAKDVPEPDLKPRYSGNFLKLAVWDVQYNLANVFLWPFYPHYKWHALKHPLLEYAGWLLRLARGPLIRRRTKTIINTLNTSGAPFYLLPLQLQTDYQLRHHSPYHDQQSPIRQVIASFAQYAPKSRKLVFKLHPLDNGLVNWQRFIAQTAKQKGVEDRVIFIDGGNLNKLIKGSHGVVTINSTVGTAALGLSCPVIALGTAIYDIPGLTHQMGLDTFWTQAEKPDAGLWDDFVRVLAHTIQVKGGYYDSDAIRAAVAGVAERLENNTVNEPNAYVDPAPRIYKKTAGNGPAKDLQWDVPA